MADCEAIAWDSVQRDTSAETCGDSLIGCKIAGVKPDGSLLVDTPGGMRLHVWRGETDEADRVERARLIDEAWLRAMGFDGPYKDRPQDEVALEAIYGGGYLSWSPMGGARLCDLYLGFTTRGQPLDLLAALGIKTKGGDA